MASSSKPCSKAIVQLLCMGHLVNQLSSTSDLLDFFACVAVKQGIHDGPPELIVPQIAPGSAAVIYGWGIQDVGAAPTKQLKAAHVTTVACDSFEDLSHEDIFITAKWIPSGNPKFICVAATPKGGGCMGDAGGTSFNVHASIYSLMPKLNILRTSGYLLHVKLTSCMLLFLNPLLH